MRLTGAAPLIQGSAEQEPAKVPQPAGQMQVRGQAVDSSQFPPHAQLPKGDMENRGAGETTSCRLGTWKQEGHMVMEASGSSERKYCHCSGGGQRLMRTSLRLMERSTDRFTTTGTNSELPCCEGRGGTWELCLWPDPPHLNSLTVSDMLHASTEVASEPPRHYRKLSCSFSLPCLR